MGKINDARKAQLAQQLENAVIEVTEEPKGYDNKGSIYKVFVPGAIREFTLVKAHSEEEAVAKAKVCLEQKIDLMPESEVKADDVAVEPDNLKVNVKGKVE